MKSSLYETALCPYNSRVIWNDKAGIGYAAGGNAARHSAGRQTGLAACDTGDAGAVCQYFVQRGRPHVCRPYCGLGRGCARGRGRVRPGRDHDHRVRCAGRLRRRAAHEHPHGAARHGRRAADRRQQLLSAAGALGAGDRPGAGVPAADPVCLRRERRHISRPMSRARCLRCSVWA